jgi:predicted dehydrogenase
MARRKIRFGIIGLGLMGKEFGSSIARWCNLLDDSPQPVITGICNKHNRNAFKWFQDNFAEIKIATTNYRELLDSEEIDAVYCAVPHNLHEELYTSIIKAGKHLLGEKPFGIDKQSNSKILEVINQHPDIIVRCSSEFPYFPGAQYVANWLNKKRYGRLIEVKAGLLHSSDMDLKKPINWKRMIDINGEYGCMGDLGMHTQHIPFRMGWFPKSVYADLSNIVERRTDKSGKYVPCETWDNAVITCKCTDSDNGKDFSLILETKRMAPGQTNTWFIEVYGTEGSIRYSTSDTNAVYYCAKGKEQGWTRVGIGYKPSIPTVTGGIFEFGFPDALQQMLGNFMYEFRDDDKKPPFSLVTPEETRMSHKVLSAALESFKSGKRIKLQ